MINVNIRYKGKELSTVLPKSNNELNAELKNAGRDIPAAKLKLRSSPKDKYLVGLYTNNPLDDLIIDRLCNNDNLMSAQQQKNGFSLLFKAVFLLSKCKKEL